MVFLLSKKKEQKQLRLVPLSHGNFKKVIQQNLMSTTKLVPMAIGMQPCSFYFLSLVYLFPFSFVATYLFSFLNY